METHDRSPHTSVYDSTRSAGGTLPIQINLRRPLPVAAEIRKPSKTINFYKRTDNVEAPWGAFIETWRPEKLILNLREINEDN